MKPSVSARRSRRAWRAYMLLQALLLATAVLGCTACTRITRLSADETADDVSVWIYDSDASPDHSIEARVRLVGGYRARIDRVTVDFAGQRHVFNGAGDTWDQEIVVHELDDISTDAEVEVVVPTPPVAADGERLLLELRVDFTRAEPGANHTFYDETRSTTFRRDVIFYTPRTSLVRRVGKAGLALLAAALVVLVIVAVRVWLVRRNQEPSNVWVLLLFPYPVLGYVAFIAPSSDATRLHGSLFVIVALVAWFALLRLPAWFARRAGLHRYTVSQVMLPMEGTDAYREPSHAVPIRPAVEIEAEWIAAGLRVRSTKREIVVGRAGITPARVPIPVVEQFGGAPFVILSRDRQLVIAMLDAIAPMLGELRCTCDHEPGELRFNAPKQVSR